MNQRLRVEHNVPWQPAAGMEAHCHTASSARLCQCLLRPGLKHLIWYKMVHKETKHFIGTLNVHCFFMYISFGTKFLETVPLVTYVRSNTKLD